jgi:hypothetical protein
LIKKLMDKKIYIIAFFVLVLFVLLTLANYQYCKSNPGGNDFLVHWVGAQNLIEDGISPYSDETALEIQTIVYGRAAAAGEHELRVVYPLFSILFFTPFAFIKDFVVARSIWMTVLEFSLFGIVVLSLRTTYWKVKPWVLAAFLLFGFFFYHSIRPLINGNAVILVTLMLVLVFIAIRNGQDEVAGLLLAFSTIKPNNVVLLLVFVLLWSLLKNRKKILYWFLGTLVLLVGFSMLIIPNWIIQNVREILLYPSYNPPGSLISIMSEKWGQIGTRFGIGLTVILSILLLIEWISSRQGRFKQFLWTALLTVAISQWIGIQTDPGNFILLLPALFLGFELLWERWKDGAWTTIFLTISVLFIGLWVLFLTTIDKNYQPIQNSIMFIPFPLTVIALLYWSKWWVLKSAKLTNGEKFPGSYSR